MARTYAAVGQLIEAHRHEAAVALGVQPGEHVLDLACGPGVNFKNILKDLGLVGRIRLFTWNDRTSSAMREGQWMVQCDSAVG
ncbi:MAG: hypothetical protein KAR21_09005 [Spirochaetales bacterium]|nr:hypothetical protein [Spirochaetales bacterium]